LIASSPRVIDALRQTHELVAVNKLESRSHPDDAARRLLFELVRFCDTVSAAAPVCTRSIPPRHIHHATTGPQR